MSTKSACLFFAIIFLSNISFSQNSIKNPVISPNFENKVNYDVDLYNGRSLINLNLFSIPFADENFNFKLSYTGGNGIKVDELPSSVGLGWKLDQPGYIVREVRGKPDEQNAYDNSFADRRVNYSGQNLSEATYDSRTIEMKVIEDNTSYLNNFSKLNPALWNTPALLLSYQNKEVIGSSPGYWLYTQGNYYYFENYTNSNHSLDIAPDEFSVSCGELQGVFYKDGAGNWVYISSNDNSGVIEEVNVVSDYMIGNYRSSNVINRIVIKSGNGLRYVFDGDFEFSKTSNTSNIRSSWSGPRAPKADAFFYDATPLLWHISKIENLNNGEYVNFTYSNSFYSVSQNNSPFGNSNLVIFKNELNTLGMGSSPDDWLSYTADQYIATRTRLLKNIIFSNGIRIDLNYENSKQLRVKDVGRFNFSEDHVLFHHDFNEIPQQLSVVELFNSQSVIKKIKFHYSDDQTKRLHLNKIEIMGDSDRASNFYNFEYVQKLLPNYGSRSKDHWGYYNGKDYFLTKNSIKTASDQTLYNQSRDPNYQYADAEMIKKISSSIGDTTEFVFQPNTYTKSLKNSTELTGVISETNGGGLRIKEVNKIFDKIDTIRTIYSYQQGILTDYIKPYFMDAPPNASTLFYFDSKGHYKYKSKDGPVTYGKVTKIIENSIKTSYEFVNHEQIRDSLSQVNTVYQYDIRDPNFRDFSFKRGRVRKISYFSDNNLNVPIKYETYKYQHDFENEVNQNYRSVFLAANGTTKNYSAVWFKRYKNHVKEVRIVEKFGVDSLISISTSRYDDKDNLINLSSSKSNGKLISVDYKYSYSFKSNPYYNSSVFKEMEDRGLTSTPIEIITKENGSVINSELTDYETRVGVIVPVRSFELKLNSPISNFVSSTLNTSGKLSVAPDYIKMNEVFSVDSRGRILEHNNNSLPKVSTVWGHSGMVKTVDIINASNDKFSLINTPGYTNVNINSGSNSSTFELRSIGVIDLKLFPGTFLASNQTAYVYYELKGPDNISKTGTFCMNNIVGSACHTSNADKNTVSFSSMPTGSYTIKISSTGIIAGSVATVGVTYSQTLVTNLGGKEFFYEGFEKNSTGKISINAVGERYYLGDYTVPFVIPNSRKYIIDYKYISDGKIYSVKRPYTNQMWLSEGDAIDEIRVYPVDAQMTTYTHSPLIGMTSKTDARGVTEFYEYDDMQRLVTIKNQNGDITKTFCYNYRGQLYDCYGRGPIPKEAAVIDLAYFAVFGNSGSEMCASTNKASYYILNPANISNPPIVAGTVLYNMDGTYAASGYYTRGVGIAQVGVKGIVEQVLECSSGWIDL